MAYNDTPLATETPAQSQPLMRQNFQQIATSYNTDHIPLSSGTNVGYSNKNTLVSQLSDPGGVASAGIIYSKNVIYTTPSATHTELFYEGEVGTGSILPITNQTLVASSGQGMLPGGLQIRAAATSISNIPSIVSFNLQFPTSCISVVASNLSNGNIVRITSITSTGFTAAAGAGGPVNIVYIAVGY